MRWAERQTRTFQKRIVEQAQRDGTLGDLFWYVVANRKGTASAVAAPNDLVPIIWIAPDPVESRHYAEMMLEIIRSYNRVLDLTLEIGVKSALHVVKWYEFGAIADWDHICPACGGINNSCVCTLTLWSINEQEQTLDHL